ncbi:MAG TPA: hypothetical protein VFI06_04295 [Chitinophagaceae bacterium]|nr:hypothetical protein [Chitinophagaceae bacterium]
MYYLRKIFACAITLFIIGMSRAQPPKFSFATDASVMRSFKQDQRYWAFGQTVNFHFHFSPRDGAYAWVCYYANGRFANLVTADAKSPSTIPQQLDYVNQAQMRFNHVSVGWKHYLKGAFDIETGWSLYGYAGFGLMFGRAQNIQSTLVDSSLYSVPVLAGEGRFKRLTLDVGLGAEVPVGADIYIYFEGRTLIPTTDYPSPYLFVNQNAPFTASVNLGLRLLFQ